MWESERLRAGETPCEWKWSMQGKAVDYPACDSFNDTDLLQARQHNLIGDSQEQWEACLKKEGREGSR